MFSKIKMWVLPSIVTHTFHLSTFEAEAGTYLSSRSVWSTEVRGGQSYTEKARDGMMPPTPSSPIFSSLLYTSGAKIATVLPCGPLVTKPDKNKMLRTKYLSQSPHPAPKHCSYLERTDYKIQYFVTILNSFHLF